MAQSTNQRLPWSQLVAELQQLCQQHRSGKLMILTDTNRFLRFGLHQGQIVMVQYADLTGVEALHALTAVQSGMCTFMSMAQYPDPPMTLPVTQEILHHLRRHHPPAAPPTPSTPSAGLSDATRTQLEQTLAGFIGPMAAILCKHVWPSVTDVGAAITALASQIPDARRAAAFAAEARSRFG